MTPATPPPFSLHHLPAGITPPAKTDPRTLGHYRVVGRIGAGGMGAVYAGLAPDGACAAVKVIHPQFAADPEFLARFAREVGMVSRVRATCAPAFHGADVRAETPWMATEYVPGRTLRQYVRENGPLTGGMLLALAAGLAEALVAVHGAGVVHRDLKPGNVILSPGGPKVLDFGIARAMEGTALTRTGGLLGTPGWIAPEQYEGQPATERSDMFAWAGLVTFAATGRDPFGTGPADVVSYRTRNDEPDLDGLPPELADVVRGAFAKDPAARPTADEALTRVTGGWRATRVLDTGAGAPAGTAPPEDAGAQTALVHPTGAPGSPHAVHPTRVVPRMLATEWRGIEAPPPRRVRRGGRSRRPLMAGAAALAVLVLLGGWFLVAPETVPGIGSGGDGGDPAGTAADGSTAGAGGAGEGGEGPAVAADPEDVGAVVPEAVELALGASSFVSFDHAGSNDIGDEPSHDYVYTEAPEPVYHQTDTFGAIVSGHVLLGEDLSDAVLFVDLNTTADGGRRRAFYREEARAQALEGGPRAMWEGQVRRMELTVAEGSEASYRGVSSVPVEWLPEELIGDRDMAERSGHHYSGTFAGEPSEEGGPARELEFDLWVGDDGYPLRFHTSEERGVETEYGEPRVDTYELDFIQFGEPVEAEVPEEAEIGDEYPTS
ncbi:serine/threonine-protein kinase [Nocardiopsis sp. NPDC058631]|uniref:serine/threonine-protein kinase n=1 Tax=Nocardiopsis sp. NPDC058631 TaxID=3346566 RepID=UPI003665F258